MWGGKKRLKTFLAGLWAVCLLCLPGLPIFSAPGDKILTAEEYSAVMKSLAESKAELKQAKRQIELLELALEKQESISAAQSNLLITLSPLWSEQENALQNKYFEGLFTGLLIGIPAGGAAGAWGGFSLGVRASP